MFNNKKAGSEFERDMAKRMSQDGFWVHFMASGRNGQPADLIAAKNGRAYLIDCKDCRGKYFTLTRIEENQRCAMDKWRRCGNGRGLFALNTDSGIYMVPFETLVVMSARRKSISMDDISAYKSYEYWRDSLEDKN